MGVRFQVVQLLRKLSRCFSGYACYFLLTFAFTSRSNNIHLFLGTLCFSAFSFCPIFIRPTYLIPESMRFRLELVQLDHQSHRSHQVTA